jgi:proteasome lid subunit RPN8/RPN11
MMEAGVVIGLNGKPLFWHVPMGRTNIALPDSRQLWDVMWENRDNLLGFAHSHPGSGLPQPSIEDITSFSGIEAGLGQRLRWWITSSDRMIELQWAGPEKYRYKGGEMPREHEPSWTQELRRISDSLK